MKPSKKVNFMLHLNNYCFNLNMTVEHPLSRAKGKAGLFWVANHAGGPVKILDGDAPVLVFVNGYLFAHAVGMKEKYGDPMPYFRQEGAEITIRASEFKNTETIINLCNSDNAPVIIRKYGYEFYIAMAPKVYERYSHLLENDNFEEDK